MTPQDRYRNDLAAFKIQTDSCQAQAVSYLQSCYDRLLYEQRSSCLMARFLFFKCLKKKKTQRRAQGLYLWGSVGRGKTYLMDCFFDALPFTQKKRLHFHRFMYQIHESLDQLKGQPDPLMILGKQWAKDTKVLCFDEFFVSDIVDAMILGRLLHILFQQGVTLVATSNVRPDDLYKNGLQRENFLPAIAQIKANCQVFHLEDGQDYRLRQLEQAHLYYYPIVTETHQILQERFEILAGKSQAQGQKIEVNHRFLDVIQEYHGVLWIDFVQLCKTARSVSDYIEIAKCYHTVFLSGVEQMHAEYEDVARRFIELIDEFYERRVKLIISAQVAMKDLYTGKMLKFEFQRCLSRLQEMQSTHYLGLAHQP